MNLGSLEASGSLVGINGECWKRCFTLLRVPGALSTRVSATSGLVVGLGVSGVGVFTLIATWLRGFRRGCGAGFPAYGLFSPAFLGVGAATAARLARE
ncbi:hypothetical protein [Thermofilum pendens]